MVAVDATVKTVALARPATANLWNLLFTRIAVTSPVSSPNRRLNIGCSVVLERRLKTFRTEGEHSPAVRQVGWNPCPWAIGPVRRRRSRVSSGRLGSAEPGAQAGGADPAEAAGIGQSEPGRSVTRVTGSRHDGSAVE